LVLFHPHIRTSIFFNNFVSVYRFAEDKANFSISTDDPMVTGKELQGDYDLANNCWGLTEAHLFRAVSNISNSFFRFRILRAEINVIVPLM
jgi:adenosine deaminase